MIVPLNPFSQSLFKFNRRGPFIGPDQIFLNRTNHAFNIRIPFGITEARENLLNLQYSPSLNESCRSRLAAIVGNELWLLWTFKGPFRETSIQPLVKGLEPIQAGGRVAKMKAHNLFGTPIFHNM